MLILKFVECFKNNLKVKLIEIYLQKRRLKAQTKKRKRKPRNQGSYASSTISVSPVPLNSKSIFQKQVFLMCY